MQIGAKRVGPCGRIGYRIEYWRLERDDSCQVLALRKCCLQLWLVMGTRWGKLEQLGEFRTNGVRTPLPSMHVSLMQRKPEL